MTCWRCVLIFCFFFGCHGLSCRSEGGYKDVDLKRMYNTCLKQQNNSSNENSRQEDWSDRGMWNNDRTSYREDRHDRMNNRGKNRDENEDRYGDRESNDRYNTDKRDRNFNMNSRDNNMHNRDSYMNSRENVNSRDNNGYGRNDQNGHNDRLSGRDDFLQSEEYDNDNSRTNYYSQYNRRNKRERHVEMNSGQRSQYNPNSHKNKGSDTGDSRNSNSSQADKACALHCLMENLHMTGDNGMPDRYLVTHAITREVKNEDLRDFLQESIEECFQILANENTEDKCEFSKNILLCLSEKGKANCDDWKDDFQF